MIEIDIKVFADKGSVLIGTKEGLFASPSEVVMLLRLALQQMEEMYPWTMDGEERQFSEYLLSSENLVKQ